MHAKEDILQIQTVIILKKGDVIGEEYRIPKQLAMYYFKT